MLNLKNYFSIVVISLFSSTIQLLSQTIQWQPLNGPFGGTPLCFVSKSNGHLFVGMTQDQRGVFKSTDNGLTWFPQSNGISLLNRDISWITVDDSNYIIIGTNSHLGARIYKSTNDGESWFETEILGGTSVTKNADGHLYVGNTGSYQYSVSTDAGYTWTHYSCSTLTINCIEINDSGHIFVGGGYTGYRSTDNGSIWTNLSLPDGINSFAFAPNGDIYAGCSREYASNSGIYRSTDNGSSWTAVKQGIRIYPTRNIVINNNGDIFVGSYGWGIWRSTDNGATWTQQNLGLEHFYIKSMYISSDGNIYAGTSDGGIYRSTNDGDSWQQVGVNAASVKRIAISPSNGYIFSIVNGVSRSTDKGLSWQPVNNGISNLDIRTINIKSDGTIFCGVGNWDIGVVYRSTNNGNSWERADNGLPDHDVSGFTYDSVGNIYVSIDYNGVYKSTNNGDNWFNIGNPPGGKLVFNSIGDLFLGSYGGGLWKLPASDTIWVNLTSNYGYNWIYTLYIGSNDYLYTDVARSTDNGLTWERLPTILTSMVYSYAENSVGHLFAGTFNFGNGVLQSRDNGNTWEYANSGIPTSDVRSVAIDKEDYLYAGAWGYSLFKTTTATITSVEEDGNRPISFYLEQNYPNPFNPTTMIKYEIPKESFVTLKVFNLLGQEVATLVDEYKSAGSYEVKFNPSSIRNHLSSGVYFYQIKSGNYLESKKMIYIR